MCKYKIENYLKSIVHDICQFGELIIKAEKNITTEMLMLLFFNESYSQWLTYIAKL